MFFFKKLKLTVFNWEEKLVNQALQSVCITNSSTLKVKYTNQIISWKEKEKETRNNNKKGKQFHFLLPQLGMLQNKTYKLKYTYTLPLLLCLCIYVYGGVSLCVSMLVCGTYHLNTHTYTHIYIYTCTDICAWVSVSGWDNNSLYFCHIFQCCTVVQILY